MTPVSAEERPQPISLWQKGSDPLRAGDFQSESIALQRVRPLLPQADSARGATICIPNTAAIIRGTRHLDAARQLVDYLASAEVELKLARSKSRQVPLGPIDDKELPADVRRLKAWAADGLDLRHLLPARRECLDWLKSEYLK